MGFWVEVRRFVRLVFEKAADDNVFFLASGMTFGTLVAAVPLLLLVLSVAGLLLAPQFEAPQTEVMARFWEIFPVADAQIRQEVGRSLQEVARNAGQLGLLSALAFVWFSTRLFGSLRAVLGEVFDLGEGRGVVRGKLLDVQMVLVSTVLLCLNVALTSFLRGLGRNVLLRLGLEPGAFETALGLVAAFFFVYLMFLFIFKFVTLNRVPWRSASLAALISAVGFELLKTGFGWWVSNYADFSVLFFGIATLVVVVIAVYYGCVLFVLSGEIAQVVELRRTVRNQREMFES